MIEISIGVFFWDRYGKMFFGQKSADWTPCGLAASLVL